MTFKQIRTKLKETQKKLDITNLMLEQERSFNSSFCSFRNFAENKIYILQKELIKQHDAKKHIISNTKKCKDERNLYYGRWIDEIDKNNTKYLNLNIFLFLLGLGVGIILGLGVLR